MIGHFWYPVSFEVPHGSPQVGYLCKICLRTFVQCQLFGLPYLEYCSNPTIQSIQVHYYPLKVKKPLCVCVYRKRKSMIRSSQLLRFRSRYPFSTYLFWEFRSFCCSTIIGNWNRLDGALKANNCRQPQLPLFSRQQKQFLFSVIIFHLGYSTIISQRSHYFCISNGASMISFSSWHVIPALCYTGTCFI